MLELIKPRSLKEAAYVYTKLLLAIYFVKYFSTMNIDSSNSYILSQDGHNILILSGIYMLVSSLVLYFFEIWAKRKAHKKIKLFMKKDEVELISLKNTFGVKFFISTIPGFFYGFFIMPLFTNKYLINIPIFLKILDIFFFAYVLWWCLVFISKKNVLTNQRILSLSIIKNKIENFSYADFQSIIYDKLFIFKEIRATISEKVYVYILNFKNLEEIYKVLKEHSR